LVTRSQSNQQAREEVGFTVHISNLSYKATEEDILEEFGKAFVSEIK